MMRADLSDSLSRLLRCRAGDVLRLSMLDGANIFGVEHYVVAARACEFIADPDRGLEIDSLPIEPTGAVEFVTKTATGEAWVRLRTGSGGPYRCNVWAGPFREVAP